MQILVIVQQSKVQRPGAIPAIRPGLMPARAMKFILVNFCHATRNLTLVIPRVLRNIFLNVTRTCAMVTQTCSIARVHKAMREKAYRFLSLPTRYHNIKGGNRFR